MRFLIKSKIFIYDSFPRFLFYNLVLYSHYKKIGLFPTESVPSVITDGKSTVLQRNKRYQKPVKKFRQKKVSRQLAEYFDGFRLYIDGLLPLDIPMEPKSIGKSDIFTYKNPFSFIHNNAKKTKQLLPYNRNV